MQTTKGGVVAMVTVAIVMVMTSTPGSAATTPRTQTTSPSSPASSDLCFPNDLTGTTDPQSTTDFGMDMFRQLVKEGNVFFSPFNLWSALLLAYVGAEGDTKLQMNKLLRLHGKRDSLDLLRGLETEMAQRAAGHEGLSIDQVSRVYIDNTFKIQPCAHTALSDRLHPIDFDQKVEAADSINGFVNNSTRGLIPNIVTPDDLARTKMAVVSAVYFNGAWQYRFNPNFTEPRPFYRNPKERPEIVKMMVMENKFGVGVSEQLGARVLRLPYTSGTVAMYVLLPSAEGEEAFNAMVNALSAAALKEAKSLLRTESVKVSLPKFKMSTDYKNNLKEALQVLGATDMFDQRRANFSSFSELLYVSTVAHKAFVDVSEKGTEAAAVTAVVFVTRGGGRREEPPFVADRPFVFLIYDEVADVTLFAGAYKSPPSA